MSSCVVKIRDRLQQGAAKLISKLISGGQTGADSSVIEVGRRLGIAVGGLVPMGWRTEQGPRPELERLGFTQSDSRDYRVRTRRNVEQSDATLIFAVQPDSDGTRLTIEHARELGRPWLLVDPFQATVASRITNWLEETRPVVLNVAGNRESKAPGIAVRSQQVLYTVLATAQPNAVPRI